MKSTEKRLELARAERGFLKTFVGPPKNPQAAKALQSKIERRELEILELAAASESREKLLEFQRKTFSYAEGVRRVRPMEPHTRRTYLAKKPKRPLYLLQLAFSDPSDYFECARSDETRLSENIVVDPDLVPDGLFESLGIRMEDSERIFALRSLFPKLQSFGEKTGRISVIRNP